MVVDRIRIGVYAGGRIRDLIGGRACMAKGLCQPERRGFEHYRDRGVLTDA